MIVSCECGAKLKVDEAKFAGKRVKVRCPRCGNVIPLQQSPAAAPASKKTAQPSPQSPGQLVLVAHDSDVVRFMISGVLTDAGFRVEMAVDGHEALKKAVELKPKGMVLDVGLPGIYGFVLCEKLKGDPATRGIKIVLLSSVYDKRRYKRTPTNLYGADDYIEKHHIPDFLLGKIRRLLFPEQFAIDAAKTAAHVKSELPEMSRPPAREFEPSIISREQLTQLERDIPEPALKPAAITLPRRTHSHESTAIMPESISLEASIFQKEECDIPRVDERDPEAIEKARRFARIIVSDIALYNQELVIEGIRKGTFFDLLKTDVDEGRELYEKRVPPGIRAQKDYYQEAFDNFIGAAKKKNVR